MQSLRQSHLEGVLAENGVATDEKKNEAAGPRKHRLGGMAK